MTVASELCLSVVIPSFNTAELTVQCLTTLQQELPPRGEVIVVDDGSRDDTVARIRAGHPGVLLICHEQPQGFTSAANHGMARAGGDVLLLLNSDTEIPRHGLDALLPAFAEQPRLGIAGAELTYPDGSAQWGGGPAPGLIWLLMLTSGLPGLLALVPGYRRLRPLAAGSRRVDWVTGAALAIRRKAWDDVGPLDRRYRFYCQDLDLCLRVAAAGWEVQQLPSFQVIHHLGASIGKEKETTRHGSAPELLWQDLLIWARHHRGSGWAVRAAWLMWMGGWSRTMARTLIAPLVPAQRRAGWRRETGALRAGLAALKKGSIKKREGK
jgi:GT2 family glycosyltransferase